MEFAFNDDQLAFRDAVRALLAKECTPEVVRSAWPEGALSNGARPGEGARANASAPAEVWLALAEMGVLGIAVPEEHGGLGMGAVDWVLLAEETGYAALPGPFVETACVAGPLLAATEDSFELLPGLVDGSATVGIAVQESVLIPWGDQAAALIILRKRRDWEAQMVEGKLSACDALDGSLRLTEQLQWQGKGMLGDSVDAAAAFDRGALAVAAQLVGLGRRMLDLTVEYVTERKQFGTPVGAQQAVKHHLADASLQLTFAAPAVYRAAWSLSSGVESAARDVSMAKSMASDAARLVARKTLQCHGAIGYTVEYDLHLYLKRAEALARMWGDAVWHRRRVADALGI